MPQNGWAIDLTRCVGCHACAVACKAELNTPPVNSPMSFRNAKAVKVDYRRVHSVEGGTYPTPTRTFVTMSCNHCYEPACLKSCPVGAISKRASDGVVLIDYDLCIGCKYCMWACPYGAPQFNETTKKVEKCTCCDHLLAAGRTPACVTTCPTKALTFDSAFIQANSGLNAPAAFAPPSYTIPAVRFTT